MISMENIFRDIYEHNMWGNLESRSGPGSSLAESALIGLQLKRVVNHYGIKSMLDLPCGDFNWMKKIQPVLKSSYGCEYIGGDIVESLVSNNKVMFPDVDFRKMDITVSVPKVDLIFCRDCLVHFPFEFIKKALKVVKNSGSKYLLTTHFPMSEHNAEIPIGHWRPLNMCKFPFMWPEPIDLLAEGLYQKTLGLWEIQKLPI